VHVVVAVDVCRRADEIDETRQLAANLPADVVVGYQAFLDRTREACSAQEGSIGPDQCGSSPGSYRASSRS
jgi:hypothetical protein